MKISLLFFITFLLSGCGSGHQASESQSINPLVARFQPQTVEKDTLTYFVATEFWEKQIAAAAPLPDSLLSHFVGPALMEKLSFTGEATYFAGKKISIDKHIAGCVIYTEDNWFKKVSLLLYHANKDVFFDVIPLAELYGGESGRMYISTWLYKSKGSICLFQKHLDVSMRLAPDKEDEPIETRVLAHHLLQWQKTQFEAIPLTDSVHFCRKFPYSEE